MHKEIETLLPHRNPFLYVDEIVTCSPEEIYGTKIYSDQDLFLRGSFPDFNYVPGTILLESMAQCGGAGIRKLGITGGLFGLASIEAATFLKGVEYNKLVSIVIKNIKLGDRLIRQSGVTYSDGSSALEATWTCIRFK